MATAAETVSKFDFEMLVRRMVDDPSDAMHLIRGQQRRIARFDPPLSPREKEEIRAIELLEACVEFIRDHHPPARPPKPKRHW